MINEERKKGWYWVSFLHRIRPDKLHCITEMLGSPCELMKLTDAELNCLSSLTDKEIETLHIMIQKKEEILETYDRLNEKNIYYICEEDEEYPCLLSALPDRPAGLFVRGDMKHSTRKVAIVGARACSPYGRECAVYFAEVLSKAGITVISGMAYGVDCAAQEAASAQRGGSIAVLGGGTDICYPKENYKLYSELPLNGAVISEMPPGTLPKGYLFVRRNRIISGMSDAVIVVEAREKSGSLITADYAAEQGRLVYAIPGRIDSVLSRGCNELIRNGAILLKDPKDILEDLKLEVRKEFNDTAETDRIRGSAALSVTEQDVYSRIGTEILHLEDLVLRTGYPPGNLMHVLLQLEMKGYICQNPQNYYRKTGIIPPKSHNKARL